MIDFEIGRCTRKCFVTGRELAPGDTYYSVLVSEGSNVVRREYAAESWSGAPEGAIGWWKSQMPTAHAKRAQLAPSEVMLNYLAELEGRPDKEDERYVLALLMIRRRVVHQERTENDASGREILMLRSAKTESDYRVLVATPTPERIQQIQDELGRLLYST